MLKVRVPSPKASHAAAPKPVMPSLPSSTLQTISSERKMSPVVLPGAVEALAVPPASSRPQWTRPPASLMVPPEALVVPADLPMPCWSHPVGLSLVDPANRGTWCCRRGSHDHGHRSAAATDCHDGPVATTSRPRTQQRSWPRLHPRRRRSQPRPSRPRPWPRWCP